VRILVQPPDGVGWGRDAPALRVGPDGRESRTGYADAGPLLVTNAASLADLNRRRAPLPPLPMGRFRPNVVVEGPPAWAEDGWATLEVEGGVVIDLGKPCPRCAVINTDQETGGFDPEPLNALAAFRTVRPDGGDDCCPTGVMFGLNAAHRAPGVLRVGATVRSHGKGSGARTFSR